MNDRPDPTRHALDDAELEVLLTGKIDDTPELRHNPVAAFLLDARQTNFAPSPSPHDSLNDLFHTTHAGAGADDPVPASLQPAPLESALAKPAPVEVYKASTLRAVLEALSPSTSKVLMALSAVLLLVIGAQAFGAIQILGDGGDGDDVVAGIDPANTITSTTTTMLASSRPTTVTPRADDAVDGTATSATTARTASTEAPTTAVTEVPETSEPTVEPTTDTTEAPETTESSTTEIETTTIIGPSTSPVTSLPTSIPSTVTISPTTTTPTSIGPAVVIITPGRRYRSPGDLPSGFYSARVSEESECEVDVTYAEGNTETFRAPAGGTIVFQLFAGSEVVTAAGCPQIYRPSPR